MRFRAFVFGGFEGKHWAVAPTLNHQVKKPGAIPPSICNRHPTSLIATLDKSKPLDVVILCGRPEIDVAGLGHQPLWPVSSRGFLATHAKLLLVALKSLRHVRAATKDHEYGASVGTARSQHL
jgi:hypothetical protein